MCSFQAQAEGTEAKQAMFPHKESPECKGSSQTIQAIKTRASRVVSGKEYA